jgi:hypothetical protein
VHWSQLEPGQWQRSRDWDLRHKGKEPLRHGQRKPKDAAAESTPAAVAPAPRPAPQQKKSSSAPPPPPPDPIPEETRLLPSSDPMAELQTALRHAIADEDYEHAAAIRDQIRKLREGDPS